MQPPSIKSGSRPTNPSCYDPNRAEKIEYGNLGMPSNAMAAAIERNLLKEAQEGN